MNRVGLKDYLLNYADDIDLLDCAKAWDAANEYGQFDTYSSVEEAAQAVCRRSGTSQWLGCRPSP